MEERSCLVVLALRMALWVLVQMVLVECSQEGGADTMVAVLGPIYMALEGGRVFLQVFLTLIGEYLSWMS